MNTAQVTASPLVVRDEETGIAYVVDPDTGEVLAQTPQPFGIDSNDKADWVFNRMLDVEIQIARVEESDVVQEARRILASEEVLRAQSLLQGAQALQGELSKRLGALHKRFDTELATYAKGQLGPKDGRTWRTMLGSVSLRKSQGSVKIKAGPEAMALAVQFAREFGQAKAIQESVLPGAIKADVLLAKERGEGAELLTAFDIEEPGDKETVATCRSAK